MSNLYKDLIVDEADGKVRYNLVGRDGESVVADVRLEIASPLEQEGDRVGAKEFNFLLKKDDEENLRVNFVKQYTATLTAAGWSGGKTQSIAISGMQAGSLIFFGYGDAATEAQKLQYSYAVIGAATQDGTVQFAYAGTKPTVNIPVLIVDFGVI